MLHPLAQVEINKLQVHGVVQLTYDEVAALQMAAVAVDEAVKSEGLPVGLPRPVRLADDVILFPMTLAAQEVLEAVQEWVKGDSMLSVLTVAYLLAHGREVEHLRSVATDRRTFQQAVVRWAKTLPVTPVEIAAAVEAVFDVEADAPFRVDTQACDTVARLAEAQGDKSLAAAIQSLRDRLLANRRQILKPHVARPSWGIITHRLAALTGCPPDAWSVAPTAEALDAYVARFDFAALSSGLGGNPAADPAERAQRDALRHLFATTDAIARAHRREVRK